MNEYIIVKHKEISGLKNPKFNVIGEFIRSDLDLVVKADGKEIEYECYHNIDNFILNAVLNKKVKNVTLYAKENNDLHEIFTIKNRFLNRLINRFQSFFFKPVNKLKLIFRSLKNGIVFLWREHHFLIPPSLWKKYFLAFVNKVKSGFNMLYLNPFRQEDYLEWISNCEEKTVYEELKYQPKISIIIPVYNIKRIYLEECLDSILNQHYQNFEICIADDCSTLQETIDTLKEYEEKDKRIRVVYRKKNGHISRSSNDALKIATGEFVGLMDNDDVLTPNALYEMVLALNKNKNLDLIYSDEDKIDMKGKRCDPHFKPDYSPDTLYGANYICHFEILRKKIIDEIGGFRVGLEGAQDHDLFLRFVEKTTPEKICHIPKILYHWRKIPGSTADTIANKEYAIKAGQRAVEDALKRRKLDAEVLVPITSTQYIVNYKYQEEPKVSIIIPTKDLAKLLRKCLNSIYQKTIYKNFEVIVVNNNSSEKETYELFDYYKEKYDNFRVIDAMIPFNYSKLNNLAVKEAKGDYLLFLNNDTIIKTSKWLNIMVGYAMQKHIGAVGVKLLYPDDTIQHAGVILGLGHCAAHAFAGENGGSYGMYGRLLVPYNYSAVTAACMMVSKKKFMSVKGFDEKLKVAFNDVDFCLKLLDKKYYNIFLPQVVLYHYESKTRGYDTTTEKYQLLLKEIDYLNSKWHDILHNDLFYNKNFSLKKSFVLDKKNEDKENLERN